MKLNPDGAFALKAKRGFTLINTSRGGLVDSEALLAALRDGTVGAAGWQIFTIDIIATNANGKM